MSTDVAAPAGAAPGAQDTGSSADADTTTDAGTDTTTTVPDPGRTTVRAASRGDTGPAEPATSDPGESADQASTTQPTDEANWSVESLPRGAQELISSLRRESGDRRAETKKLRESLAEVENRAGASDEKLATAIEAFAKAVGLTPEEPGADAEPPTPEKLTDQLDQATKAHEATEAQLRESRVELAVYRAAGKAGADPDALLDSRTFLAKVKTLDPNASDFGDEVSRAIKAAISTNPKLKAAPAVVAAPAPSGGRFSGGPAGRSDADLSVDDARARLRTDAKRRAGTAA